jgi:Ca2+-binding RTX toxin-like protein
VIFESNANNFVTGDTNNTTDIFRKDMLTGTMVRLSVAPYGAQANGSSTNASLSADGRYLVFTSTADNLVAGDLNGVADVFRKDLETGEIVRVSTSTAGFQGNDGSMNGSISADGRYVVFSSYASNLVQGDTNAAVDIFRKDLVTGEVIRLSAAADGTQSNNISFNASISPDGRYVVFESMASNLVADDTGFRSDVFRVDTAHWADAQAIIESRFIELTLDVGSASKVSLAWGDGSASTVIPAGNKAGFSHAYATTGLKTAVATVSENGQSWSISYTINLITGTMTRNTAVASIHTGGSSNDLLTGDAFSNKIYGGLGRDVLKGGLGQDSFVFNTKLSSSNIDTISDFRAVDDTIVLENAIFKKLAKTGALSKSFFVIGSKAKDKNDYLIYNKGTGDLFYDPDGSGASKAIKFAHLVKGTVLNYNDFHII